MRKIHPAMRGVIAASMIFMASPAFAGDEERALAAIAQAQGKIDAALRMKPGEASPDVMAQAQASLRLAKEQYESGKEQKAIASAVEAQRFADTAIGEKNATAEMDAEVHVESAAAAQQEAVNANARADAAEQRADRVASRSPFGPPTPAPQP